MSDKKRLEEVKKELKLNSCNWEIACIYKYLQEYPEEGNFLISRISVSFFRDLLNLPPISFFTQKIFEKAEYFDWFCFLKYKNISLDKFKKVNEIEIRVFESKIKEWDDPEAVIYLLRILKEIGYPRFEKVKPSIFESMIEKWEDL